MTEKNPIELHLLGEMRIHAPGNGAEGELAGQTKRLALLVYLALEPGFHRRESVMDLFWPEREPDAARKALRQALYHLRKTLDREVFRTRGDEIGIDPLALWCDATALERASDDGDDAAAVDLFRGDLLPGFHVDGVSPELERLLENARARIRHKGLRVLRRMAERAHREERHDDAVRLARRALLSVPHDEPSLRILLKALLGRGDRVEASRVGEAFVERLRNEMGFEPSPETLAVLRAVEERPAPESPERGARPLPPSLPSPLTTLVGREREIDFALGRLTRSGVRMLTLTGPGGVGKSRLAVEVAQRAADAYPDGVAWVGLDVYSDPTDAFLALARTVEAEVTDDRDPRAALSDRLRGLRALLVLDGLDHVPDLGTAIAELLGDASGVDALLTSRTPTGHSAENRLPVPPLSLPERGRPVGGDLPLDSEAVALFVDRAGAADPSFRLSTDNVNAVIDVVRRLDGLPLAIELAAGRTCHLPVEELARRLVDDQGLLRAGARDRPDRHGTLDATIRWTSEDLEEDERALLHGLATFVGDFGLSTVEAVWPALGPSDRPALDVLSILIDRGFVYTVRDPADRPRYRLLRTIREHAAHALEASGARTAWMRGLAEHYAAWAQEGFRHYCGPGEKAWLETLDAEAPNLDAVVDWAIEAEPVLAARIVAPTIHWSTVRGVVGRTRRRVERILDAVEASLEAGLRGRLRVSLAQLALYENDTERAIADVRRGLEVYREAEDVRGQGWAVQTYANILFCADRLDEALEAARQGLEIGERTDNAHRIDQCGRMIASIAHLRGDFDRAVALYDRALAHARAAGSASDELKPLICLAQIELERDRPELAERHAREALRIAEDVRSTNATAWASRVLADTRRALGRPDGVHVLYVRALELYREMGNEEGVGVVLVALAELALESGDVDGALRLVAALANRVEERDLRLPGLRRRLDGAVERLRDRVGAEALDRERAATRGVTLERLLDWAGDLVPTVEIRLAAR